MDMRCYGKGFDRYYERTKNEYGVRFVRSRISGIEEESGTNNLVLKYESEDGILHSEEFDLIVLSVGLSPPKDAENLAKILDIRRNRYGFGETMEFHPLETSRERLLTSARGTCTTEKTYPPEQDVSGDAPRIGVFICNCGINIGGVVDVPAVTKYTFTLPYVVYVGENLFTCAQDTQESICKIIKENGLNRVVVASCSPRTHEPLFQETLRQAGLNPYLFEMANIRDQCSWVHMKQPREATEKAKDLVRMAVRKAAYLTPLVRWKTPVTKAALVIGGGISGMTAALSLAEQNFRVAIVEKETQR
ncbi:MAG: FAD-binding protein, partial [Candidatus Sumerlaeota bacterium]|nr:FAD-binding protein [Candidatus Sumerlaeota bacterium]